MIRQAISCDICGAEKRQTNHWFIAWEHDGELRVSGWNARGRLRANSKHLCGQACLHKLADDFMERIITHRSHAAADEHAESCAMNDTSLLAEQPAIHSSARVVGSMEGPIRQTERAVPALVSMPERLAPTKNAQPAPEAPRSAMRNWHAEAWLREQKRNQGLSVESTKGAVRRLSHA